MSLVPGAGLPQQVRVAAPALTDGHQNKTALQVPIATTSGQDKRQWCPNAHSQLTDQQSQTLIPHDIISHVGTGFSSTTGNCTPWTIGAVASNCQLQRSLAPKLGNRQMLQGRLK